MKRVLAACCLAGSILWAQTGSNLPDGAGKVLVERSCSKCHDLVEIIRSKNTREGWARLVDEMVSRGAEGSDQELEQIVAYLTTNFSPAKVNVNKALWSELSAALAVSREPASAIVEYR